MHQIWSSTPSEGETVHQGESTLPEVGLPPASSERPAVPPPREAVEPSVRAWLVINRGPHAGTSIVLGSPRMTIGRGSDCDLVIDDTTVSRYHAELGERDGHYVLEDTGSLNGTYVNRRQVRRAELIDCDEIWIGKARFLFLAAESEVRA